MPFIVPSKRNSISKSTKFSGYKPVATSPFFILQKRKAISSLTGPHRPECRIITNGVYPIFEVAYGNSLKDLKDNEWMYIIKELPHKVPSSLNDQEGKLTWLVAHFTQLAVERPDGAVELIDDSDDEDEFMDSETEGILRNQMHLRRRNDQTRSFHVHGAIGGGRPLVLLLLLLMNLSWVGVRLANKASFLYAVCVCNALGLLAVLKARGLASVLVQLKELKEKAPQEGRMDAQGCKPRSKEATELPAVEQRWQAGASLTKAAVPTPATAQEDSYGPTPHKDFLLRVGPQYRRHKRKAGSESPLFELVSMDVFAVEKRVPHVARYLQLPASPFEDTGPGPVEGVPPWLVINMQVPNYVPSMFAKNENGPGYLVVLIFAMKPETRTRLGSQDTAAVRLLKAWVEGLADPTMHGRLKCIPRLRNGDELELGAMKKLMNGYESKPFMTGPQCHSFEMDAGRQYLEIDMNVHKYGYLARRGLSGLMPAVASLIFDLGWTIQGETDEELPEQLLCCARVSKINMEEVRNLFKK